MKKRQRKTVVVLASWAIVIAASYAQANPTVVRPIEDFVAQQGTFCFPDGMGGCLLFVPPVGNFIGWSDPATNRCASVDYSGLANQWIEAASGGAVSFGTSFVGSVRERPLADGTTEVLVQMLTRNALTWVIDGCEDFASNPLLFGYRAPDVLASSPPAFCNSVFSIKFTNTAPGAPLPDLIQLAFFPELGQSFISLSIDCSASGMLADGTPGRAVILERGLFMTPFAGAVGDGFPVERIHLHPYGR